MGLFEKKFCSVCGEKIGLLGNRKLEDGNLCKSCAGKLSPWFSERRSSTVEEIKSQLAYREENRAAVESFRISRTIGRSIKVLVDESAGLFMVTGDKDLREANPDVIPLAHVTGCDVETEEHRMEVYRTVKDGEGKTRNESYSPRRFTYSYDFNIIIHVNHPYFNEIRFQLNSSSVKVPYNDYGAPGGGLLDTLFGTPAVPPARRPLGAPEGSTTPPPAEVCRSTPAFAEYEAMAEEIRGVLMQARQEIWNNAAAAAAPRQKVTCPHCGATTVADAAGCCEYCGGPLGG